MYIFFESFYIHTRTHNTLLLGTSKGINVYYKNLAQKTRTSYHKMLDTIISNYVRNLGVFKFFIRFGPFGHKIVVRKKYYYLYRVKYYYF